MKYPDLKMNEQVICQDTYNFKDLTLTFFISPFPFELVLASHFQHTQFFTPLSDGVVHFVPIGAFQDSASDWFSTQIASHLPYFLIRKGTTAESKTEQTMLKNIKRAKNKVHIYCILLQGSDFDSFISPFPFE